MRRQRSRVVRAVGASLAFVALGATLAAPAAAAPPEARAITATPSADLVDGQDVTIEGTGWRPGRFVDLLLCIAATEDCAPSFVQVEVDPTGAFSGQITVRTVFTSGQGTAIDCRVDACAAVAVDDSNENHLEAVPLAFDPDAPLLPPPSITADPSTGLIDGQTVEVAGSSFFPDSYLYVAQCPAGATSPTFTGCAFLGDTVVTDDAGAFTTTVAVRTLLGDDSRRIDCRVEACELLMAAAPVGGIQARVAVAFDPAGPLLPDPSLTVTPSTGLASGDAVAVVGSGFHADEFLAVLQCPSAAGSLTRCGGASPTTVSTEADGTFAVSMIVRQTFVGLGGGATDCGVDRCVIRVIRFDTFEEIDAPIEFALPPAGSPAHPVAAQPRFTG